MLKRLCLTAFLLAGIACSGSSTTTAPTPAPSPTSPPTTVLTGQVMDRVTSAPMPGANVIASYPPHLSATTDSLGNYSLSDLPAWFAYVWATAENHESDVQKYRSAVQNFRVYPIQRITAGDSTVVTVAPDDPLCNNNLSSPGWGADYLCRIVRVVALTDGTMTLEALPIEGGARPPLEVETGWGQRGCCSERLENPTSIKVKAGAEVIAQVEMAPSATASQTFTLTTSMAGR